MTRLSAPLLALLFAICGASLRAAPTPRKAPSHSIKANKLLHPGRYRCEVNGVLCNACTRAIVEEVKVIPDLKDARFDFEDGYLWITIGKDRKVRLTEVERALRMAARRLELGVDFKLTDVQYVP